MTTENTTKHPTPLGGLGGAVERFADIQMLRYRLTGFSLLSLQQKLYIYYLSEATLWGRDITFQQFGRYNLPIRRLLEKTYLQSKEVEQYLCRVWFSSGIHHHYGLEKFKPDFSRELLRQFTDDEELLDAIFDESIEPTRICTYYRGVSDEEIESFHQHSAPDTQHPLNSNLVKTDNEGLTEEVWRIGGVYGKYIEKICYWLDKARLVAENDQQKKVISLLIDYYSTGDPKTFDLYNIEWLKEQQGRVDFVNGFIEVYSDPNGLKGSWEALVEYKDLEASKRTQKICQNAQWFEDHSPIDPRFRKPKVTGVTANVICAAMLGGDEYPASAIGINLPNADWIRAQYGSKSVTIGNLTEAYNEAAKGNGFRDEFIPDAEVRAMLEKYDDACDDLHTDLHECLGHGSGQLLPGVDENALKEYGSTIEEARADLFGLYFIADEKLVELGILPNLEAHHAQYYTYLLNGLLTQMVRIKPGANFEEAHMRNRAIIARWVLAHAEGCVELRNSGTQELGKTVLVVNDYVRLRVLFGELLAEVQRIKSEGDFEAAKALVETYGVKLDANLHKEVLQRYEKLNIAPYKGFINPRLIPVKNDNGDIIDIKVDYTESFIEQNLRYSRQYSLLD